MDPPHDGFKIGCLKQVIVPDKSGLNALRKEVDVMKTLRLAKHIVRYYDSNAERLPDGQYQVLVLMELCPNNSLLEYMNARIRTKLTEKEILKIMVDITLGLYEMHKIKLVHRDVKIENVLIDANHVFKLCDFGSVSVPIRPPQDQREFQLLSHDILYQTTPQYRSPEMVDLYRALPIDEKSDIWALGCFLYKLCYYTTPFEANGDIAILHASFQFLPQPEFSGDLKNLIIIMLQENPLYRPNVVQILMLLCQMTGQKLDEYDVEDFYHAGPFNFQALHAMQQQKQEELRKQQQLYFEQQKQQQEYERRKQRLAAQEVPQRSSSQRSHSQQPLSDVLSNALNVASPNIKAHGSSASLASPQQVANMPLAQVPIGQIQPNSMPRVPPAASVPQQPAQVVPANVATSPVAQSLSVYPDAYARDESQANMGQLSYDLIALNSSAPADQQPAKKVEDSNGESSAESDIDLEEIAQLTNAEERYPSLDALNNEAEKVTAKLNTSNSGKESSIPGLNETEPNNKAPSQEADSRKSSELASKLAWEKPQALIDKDAEKLVDDIFASKTGPSETAATSAPSTSSTDHQNKVSALQFSRPLADEPPRIDGESALQPSYPSVDVTVVDEPKIARKANPELSQRDAFINGVDNLSPTIQPVVAPNIIKQSQYRPDYPTSYSLGQVPTLERKDANPWGGSLKQGRSPRPAPASNSPEELKIQNLSLGDPMVMPPPQVGLAPQAVKSGNTSAAGSRGPSMELDRNLIQLEVGLSSGESSEDTPPPLPPHPAVKHREEVSLLDIDGNEGRAKPVMRKSLSQNPGQPFEVREEVIDFASDDENQKLEMSRLSIRNSLRKSRKLNEQRRSDSSHSEHKRRSFFGGD